MPSKYNSQTAANQLRAATPPEKRPIHDAPDTYPADRGAFFAQRYCRLLTKSCAAQEIGPEACWLLTIIANLEDAKRYSAPVTFFNEQLSPLCGFGGSKRLVAVRNRAVQAGWLHYERGGKGRPGRYWVTIPKAFQVLDDSPCDESSDHLPFRNETESGAQSGTESNLPFRNETESGTENDLPFRNETESGAHSNLSLNNKDTCACAKDTCACATDEDFAEWWKAYPRKVGKARALKAYRNAIKKIEPAELLRITKLFADTPKGKGDYCPYPATWLNDERWTDDPAEWQRDGGSHPHQPATNSDSPEANRERTSKFHQMFSSRNTTS